MAFDFAAAKIAQRRVVHQILGVAAVYSDDVVQDINVHVRWHFKDGFFAPEGIGDSSIRLDGIDRIIFNAEELATPYTDDAGVTWGGCTPKRLGAVAIPQYGVTFELDNLSTNDGPVTICWNCTRS